jgi:hypothetical protein
MVRMPQGAAFNKNLPCGLRQIGIPAFDALRLFRFELSDIPHELQASDNSGIDKTEVEGR